MLGHGRSDIYERDAIFFKHADYAKVVLALMNSLKLYNVNAIGASSGGMTPLHLNTKQPDRFKSVIAIGAQIYFSQYVKEWQAKKGPDSANAKFMEWATEQHGAEKAKILARSSGKCKTSMRSFIYTGYFEHNQGEVVSGTRR